MITETRFAYRFAGITLSSEVELPGLSAAGQVDSPEVTIRLRPIMERHDCPTLGRCELLPDGVLALDLPPVARILLSVARSEIVVEHFPGATESALRHVVVDLALPRWFAAIGRPSLHATAVAVDGGVVAFLGESGMGKSTLSGAMVANGASWVADDLLLLDFEGPDVVVIPTVVSTRLRPDSARALNAADRDGQIISTYDAKRRWNVPSTVDRHRLLCMFFLDRRQDDDGSISVEEVSNGEAIKQLAEHWLLTHTGLVDSRNFFTSTATLLRSTRMLRLSYPSSFDALPSVVRSIGLEATPSSICRGGKVPRTFRLEN